MKIFVVVGTQGDYDDRSWWVVDSWTARTLADKRVERLMWCARQLREWAYADPAPDLHVESTDAEVAAYEVWMGRRDALVAKWRKLAGDELLDLEPPTYSVVEIPLRSKARRL